MQVGSSPGGTRPARGVPGKAGQLGGSPLHFLLALGGLGGTQGHLASVAPFLSSSPSSAKTPRGTILKPPAVPLLWESSAAGISRADGRGSTGGFVARHPPLIFLLPPPAPLPSSRRGLGRLLGLMFLGRRVENSCWYRTAAKTTAPVTSTMSGRVDDGGGGGGGGGSGGRGSGGGGSGSGGSGGGGTQGKGSSASTETNPGSTAAPREGAGSGGAARSGDFPVVTLDEDAVQKFAEIEARWGESRLRFAHNNCVPYFVHKNACSYVAIKYPMPYTEGATT